MAQHYRRPLFAFDLAAPPPRGDRGADFRRLSAPRRPATDALIGALVRNVRSLLDWMYAHVWAAKPVRLDVFTHNTDAVAFYRAYGFRVAVLRMEK